MRIIETRQRRKKLTAVILDSELYDLDFALERDETTGMPLIDTLLAAERGLEAGVELTEAELAELASESFYRRATSRALWYLSRSDCSEKELLTRLERSFPREASEGACLRMKELGFLNDERYAERLAEGYLKCKRIAPRKAEMLMSAKGIDRELARAALESTESDSVAVICELIEKKYSSRLTDRVGVEKTAAALARRGFSFSDIREAIRRFNEEAELTED